ncbi:MAG: helix-turn-helix transcriptional regulator [Actinobacteria bacterium]|nr:helix-turn-helix transcriptional regulator [Actinomycetota bacterium]
MTRRRLTPPAPELLTLAGAIRHLRRERELSQEALAFAADIHPKHLSEIERANKDPRSTTVVRLADALGVTVAALYEADSGRSPT